MHSQNQKALAAIAEERDSAGDPDAESLLDTLRQMLEDGGDLSESIDSLESVTESRILVSLLYRVRNRVAG